ncbi:protein FAM72A-like [Clavelina lepadiformis]|uniref:Protein FAM72A n=1 Tax=Clavelina lepadiformis TaxID=159417 RepID=A0ABP0H407_CLALP
METACHEPTIHPYFRHKDVYVLWCVYCDNELSDRTMKAILLADIKVDLYSTDLPPKPAVDVIGRYYTTDTCSCQIRDMACTKCGNPVGYHVVLPCANCLESCNNGHFWIFHQHTTKAIQRLNREGSNVLTWGAMEKELEAERSICYDSDDVCR